MPGMSLPIAPQNNLFVLIPKMYVDEITTGSGVKLFQDSSFNPEWNVTITGTVVSTPKKLTPYNHDGMPNPERWGLLVDDIQPGDEAIFKYLVVEDKDFVDDPAKFYPVEHDKTSGRYYEFCNGMREVVKVFVLSANRWAGVYLDKSGDWIGGCDGKRTEVEAWLAKNFQMLGDGDILYRNMMIHDGVIYWKVDYSLLIGYIREGTIHAGRGFVFVEPIELDLTERTEGGIIIPEMSRKSKVKRTGIARYIGLPRHGKGNLSLNVGDRVVWDHRFGEQYEIGGMPWVVVKHEHILGTEWI